MTYSRIVPKINRKYTPCWLLLQYYPTQRDSSLLPSIYPLLHDVQLILYLFSCPPLLPRPIYAHVSSRTSLSINGPTHVKKARLNVALMKTLLSVGASQQCITFINGPITHHR